MENNDRKGSTAVAFLLGAMVGGITALLFAPQTGAQMRGRLKRGANDMRQRGDRLIHNTGEKAEMMKGAATVARTAYQDEMEKRRAASPRSEAVGKEEHA
jgi:gas vesicle protein